MRRFCISDDYTFRIVLFMLYAGWVLEDVRGDWLTIRYPIPTGPYR